LSELRSAVAPRPAPAAGPWALACDDDCELKASGPTLDALCAAAVSTLSSRAVDVSCTPRTAIGLDSPSGSAVRDVAVVDVDRSVAGVKRETSYLALQVGKRWQLVRSLGDRSGVEGVGVLGAHAIDLVGLAPAAAEVRVRVPTAHGFEERLIACGATDEGQLACPVALAVARQREGGDRTFMAAAGAGIGGVSRGPGDWRVEVKWTARGYVATSVAGTAPDGLVGEHRWASR
jgi:hypothetical protein